MYLAIQPMMVILRGLGYWQNQNGIIRLWSYANLK